MTTPSTDSPKTDPKDLRSHTWLNEQLDTIWSRYFGDVEKLNIVTIRWGKHNRNRLGAITAKGGPGSNPHHSAITINALLRNPEIPESVIWQTIAHELAHYTHGFCSPHPQKYSHPHRGNVIEHELTKRGLGDVYNESEAWLKVNWRDHIHDTLGIPPPKTRRSHGTRLSILQNLTRITVRRRRIGN